MLADLPPWLVGPIFQTPTFTLTTLPTIIPASSIIAANGLRWGLFISNGDGGHPINVGPLDGLQPNQGILLNSATPFLWMTVDTHGPLVTSQWFGIAQGVATAVSVFEVIVNRWPTDPDNKIILPWQQDDLRAADEMAQRMASQQARLKDLMYRVGRLSSRWRNNGS